MMLTVNIFPDIVWNSHDHFEILGGSLNIATVLNSSNDI